MWTLQQSGERELNYFLSAVDKMNDWVGRIFSFLALIAAIVVLGEVIMRYAFNSPTIYGLDITIYVCGIMYALGGAYAFFLDAHVKIDIIYARWSPRLKAIIDLFTGLVFFVGIALLLWISAKWAIDALNKGTTFGTPWDPVIWPLRMSIPVACALMFLQGVAKFVRDIRIVRIGGKHGT